MNPEPEIIAGETSEKMKLSGVPYLMLRLDGSSYVNKKAASLLELKHGDLLRFYYTVDLKEWWVANHPSAGANIQKSSGLYKFCDLKNIRKLFDALDLPGKKAFFRLASNVQQIHGTPALFIIPKAYNNE